MFNNGKLVNGTLFIKKSHSQYLSQLEDKFNFLDIKITRTQVEINRKFDTILSENLLEIVENKIRTSQETIVALVKTHLKTLVHKLDDSTLNIYLLKYIEKINVEMIFIYILNRLIKQVIKKFNFFFGCGF